MQDFESLKMQNSIFQELEEVIQLYREDCKYKNELIKNLGIYMEAANLYRKYRRR